MIDDTSYIIILYYIREKYIIDKIFFKFYLKENCWKLWLVLIFLPETAIRGIKTRSTILRIIKFNSLLFLFNSRIVSRIPGIFIDKIVIFDCKNCATKWKNWRMKKRKFWICHSHWKEIFIKLQFHHFFTSIVID